MASAPTAMTFSDRTAWDLAQNDNSMALEQARQQAHGEGRELLDLTVSNPTACGFAYPATLLAPLSAPGALAYTPEPFGMGPARDAVVAYYREHGAALERSSVCLTTSTSEAYSYLFRLLCDPGDEVLAARPSYPLFDFIARLDDVSLREYPLLHDPHGGWHIDLAALEAAITPRTRAVIVVHPNNPTGNFASAAERTALCDLCRRHGLALIVDEVFLDYALEGALDGAGTTFAGEQACLAFVLSGLSKVCALPQMKCSWIVTSGPEAQRAEALARLEVIADTFLSMNAPVQFALPQWLAERHTVQRQIRERMAANLSALDGRLQHASSGRLELQGGWTVVLRVPRTVADRPFVQVALDGGVIVQPGEFYGLPAGRIVLSLLTPPAVWTRGLALLPV